MAGELENKSKNRKNNMGLIAAVMAIISIMNIRYWWTRRKLWRASVAVMFLVGLVTVCLLKLAKII